LKGIVDGGVHAENRWAERADLTAAFCVLVVVPADANFRLDILSQPLIMRAGQSQTPGIIIRGLKRYTRLSALATPWKATVRTCTSNVFGSAKQDCRAYEIRRHLGTPEWRLAHQGNEGRGRAGTLSTRYEINALGVIQRKERRAMRKTGFKFVFLRPARSGISQRSPRSA
jgi:hypothetical protein